MKSREKILDLGCGNGRLCEFLKEFNVQYFGTDASENLIAIARNLYPDKNFQKAEALIQPFPDNFFDKIFSIAVLHHIPSKEFHLQFFKEIIRILKPGGIFILTVWNLWQNKKARGLLLKYTTLKFLRKSKLDFKDIFYPWKNSEGEVLAQRYLHAFCKKELEKMAKESGFEIKDSGILERPGKKFSHIYLVAQKSL